MIYSHSSISTFKNCALQFKYNYIEKPDVVKKQNMEAFMGSIVHQTLEKLYTDLKYSKLLSLQEVIDFYTKHWNENYSEETVEIIRKEYKKEHYFELGKKYLTEYYETYKPFDQGKTIGLEQKVNLKLFDSVKQKTYNLVGYIDRLTLYNQNHIEIGDYKTNNKAKTQEEVDIDRQLALYSIAIKKLYPFVEKIDLAWYFLSAGIKQISHRSEEQLKDLENQIIEDIRDIENAIEKNNFPAKPSGLCDWCAFRSICPFKAHDEITKELPENEYLKEPGVVLVDKYTELTELKKELTKDIDTNIEKLKEAIIEYSKKNNFEKIFGSKKSILVREYDSIKLPDSTTSERKNLEKIIKEKNLWDQFTTLSYIKFSEAFKNKLLTPEFEQELKRYLKISKIYRVYVNKK